MSEQSEPETQDIQQRRLANSFQQHRKIQNTLDAQEKERVTDKRYAILGIILLVIIAVVALYFELSSETTTLSF